MPVSFRDACVLSALVAVLASCAAQDRAKDAANAKQTLIGKSKAEILACMGAPEKATVSDNIEAMSYYSGDHQTTTYAGGGGLVGVLLGASNSQTRNCRVNLTLTDGKVTNVLYAGLTGAWGAEDEQCGYVVKNCVAH